MTPARIIIGVVVTALALWIASAIGGTALDSAHRRSVVADSEHSLLMGGHIDGAKLVELAAEAFASSDDALALRCAALLAVDQDPAVDVLVQHLVDTGVSAAADNDLATAIRAARLLGVVASGDGRDDIAVAIEPVVQPADGALMVLEMSTARVITAPIAQRHEAIEQIVEAWRAVDLALGLTRFPGLMRDLPGDRGEVVGLAAEQLIAYLDYLMAGARTGRVDRQQLEAYAHSLNALGLWRSVSLSSRSAYAEVTALPGAGRAGWVVFIAVLIVTAAALMLGGWLASYGPEPVDPSAETLEHIDPVDVETGAATMAGSSASRSGSNVASVSGSLGATSIYDLDETEAVDPFGSGTYPYDRPSTGPQRWRDPAETAPDLDPPGP